MPSSFRSLIAALLLALAVGSNAVKRSRFSFYTMPTREAGPCDMTPTSDGYIWVQDIAVNKLARIQPTTRNVTEYTIPYTNKPFPNVRTPIGCSIQVGRDGNLYAVTGIRNQLVKLDYKTKKIQVFTPKPKNLLGNVEPFNDLSPGKEGIFFSQTTANVITFFNYKTHETKNYKVPTPAAVPIGVFVASDESVWVCEFGASKIGRLNATANTWKEYPLPASLTQPVVMRVQQGKYLYFTAVSGNGIGRIDMNTGAVKSFPAPEPLVGPGSNIADSRGNIWYSSLTQNLLGKLNPNTGVTTLIRTPLTAGSQGVNPPTAGLSLTYGPEVNSIFFADTPANRVGRLQLLKK